MQVKFFTVLLGCSLAALSPAANAENLTGTLAKVAETKTFTIGHRESAVPLSYFDDKQKAIGFQVELCEKVAEALKAQLKLPSLDVKYVAVNGSTRIPLMVNGTIDIECGSTTNTVDRQKQVAFSTTTYVAALRYASRAADKLATLHDLASKTVTSSAGSDNLEMANTLNSTQSLKMSVLPSKDFGEAFLTLETGRASALFLDDIVLAGLIANSKDPSKYVISSQAFTSEPYALMMRRDDPAFKKLVDDTLAQMYKSGEAAALYKKWFESPVPPKSINLSLPPSKALQGVWKSPTDSADQKSYQTE
jgi:glutamate/aspartate transport system substrate-binding protein